MIIVYLSCRIRRNLQIYGTMNRDEWREGSHSWFDEQVKRAASLHPVEPGGRLVGGEGWLLAVVRYHVGDDFFVLPII